MSMERDSNIFVQVDKVVVRITGVQIKGLNASQLEALLMERLKTMVRVIGVTGTSLEMDVYDLEESSIRRNEQGWIEVISLADGITVTDLASMEHVEKIKSVDINHIPDVAPSGCSAERWVPHHE